MFKVGDIVALHSNTDVLMPVIEVIYGGAECRYKVFENNKTAIYYESQLKAASAPEERIRHISVNKLHAHLTSLQILSPSTANLFSLRSGRVQFVPYQYRPVLKLIRADRPRLLIADEVGVGKTIEAGLIIKELKARMDISSVLIICPKALVAERKWYTEMKRFDEKFTALDGPLLRHCLKETHLDGEWPEQYEKAILPFSLFDSDLVFGATRKGKKKDQGLLSLEPPPKFDLVIVDEAHNMRNPSTYLHQGVRYFCDNAQAVLLLTATPVQLGSGDLFTLLNVLRPDLVIDHASFEQMAEPNSYINSAIHHCRAAKDEWQSNTREALGNVARTEWGRLFLKESPDFQDLYDQLNANQISGAGRVAIIHELEGLYTFSHLINRTRRRDIGEFTTRKPETISIDFTEQQKELHDSLLDIIAEVFTACHGQQNVKFMMTTVRRQAASCLYGLAPLLKDMLNGKVNALEVLESSDSEDEADLSFIGTVRAEVERIIQLADNLHPDDPKVEEFINVIANKSRMDNNKSLVFSTFRHTLAYLAIHTEKTGLRYGVVHGDIPDDERSDLRRRFALPKDAPEALDVLLSSEVGCEGLDFQFCDLLINYDLPWNPMRVEQRIGRLDRYGQKSETIAIYNLITPGTVDADIYERCLWRIGVFQNAIGGNEEILGKITQEIHDIAESFNLSAEERKLRLRQIADNSIRKVREEQELESKQAELFGLNIPSKTWEDEIENAESFWLSPESLQRVVSTYLEHRLQDSIDHLLGEKPIKTLRLSQEARNELLDDYKKLPRSSEPSAREWEKRLKGSSPTITVTFNQESAAEEQRAIHLTVIHPFVRQAAHFLSADKSVYVDLKAHNSNIPKGKYNFAIYHWRKVGIKPDDLLVPIAINNTVENALLKLIPDAEQADDASTFNQKEYDKLDAVHHKKWTDERSNYIKQNRQLSEYRRQSLTVSHQARCKAIEDQIARATNDKIKLMKLSELSRANADFDRRMEDIQNAASSSDILAKPVVLGVITIL